MHKTTSLIASILRSLLLFLVPIGIYSTILLVRAPFPFRQLGVAVRYSFLIPLVAIGLFLLVLFNIRGWAGTLASLSGVLALVALSVLGLWVSGQSSATVFGGLLPMYDANNYYIDAQRLLVGGLFSQFSSWRPLFPSLLALVLRITGSHLQLTVAVLSLVAGVSFFFFAREAQRLYGALAAVVSLLLLFFYYRGRISGMAMSEQLGLALGTLGLALVLRSISTKERWLLMLGVFALSLGLNARPGAFFVLPALVLWGAFVFHGRRFGWSTALIAVLAAGAGFAINMVVQKRVQSDSSLLFSNFAYALYGLVSGGKSFAYLKTVHPELKTLSGTVHFLKAYSLVLEAFLANPLGIVQGVWVEWSRFLGNSMYSVFSFIGGENPLINLVSRLALYAASLAGIVRAVFQRRDPRFSLALYLTAAVLLSVPFVPPGDSYGVRLYAATMPAVVLLPALGLSWAWDRLTVRFSWLSYRPALPIRSSLSSPLAIFTSLLAVLVLLSPFLAGGRVTRPVAAALTGPLCPSGQDQLLTRLDPGSSVNVYPEGRLFLDRLPDYHFGRFIQQVHSLPDIDLIHYFDGLTPPLAFYETIDLSDPDYQTVWLMMDPEVLPARDGLFGMCGQWINAKTATSYALFKVEQALPIK